MPKIEPTSSPIRHIITITIIATQPPARSKEIRAFVAAIIPFIADIVAFTTAFVALAVCLEVSRASFNARC
jgi:hypothetical protein